VSDEARAVSASNPARTRIYKAHALKEVGEATGVPRPAAPAVSCADDDAVSTIAGTDGRTVFADRPAIKQAKKAHATEFVGNAAYLWLLGHPTVGGADNGSFVADCPTMSPVVKAHALKAYRGNTSGLPGPGLSTVACAEDGSFLADRPAMAHSNEAHAVQVSGNAASL
jgi:hypothetical protein